MPEEFFQFVDGPSAGGIFVANAAKYTAWLPDPINGEHNEKCRRQQKQDPDRFIRISPLEDVAHAPTNDKGRNCGNRSEDAPKRADLTRHGVLSREGRTQAVLGAIDKQKGTRQQKDGRKDSRIGHRDECEEHVESRTHRTENDHVSPVH